MTPGDFRRIALALPGVVEGSHHAHADFRFGGRDIASPGDPDADFGMVRLDEARHAMFPRIDPAFMPAAGAWGRQGSTVVRLADGAEALPHDALAAARDRAAAQPARVRRRPT
jgi:hypothetical protein